MNGSTGRVCPAFPSAVSRNSGGVEAGQLRVMGFNIRGFSRSGDGINRWENRAALNVTMIKRYAPD